MTNTKFPSAETLARKSAGLRKRNDLNRGGVALCREGRRYEMTVVPWEYEDTVATVYPVTTMDGSAMAHWHRFTKEERLDIARDLLEQAGVPQDRD